MKRGEGKMSDSVGTGPLSLSLRDPWISDKAYTKSFLKVLVSFTIVFIPIIYLIYPDESILIIIFIFGALIVLFLGHLVFGKDKWIVSIPTLRRRDKKEYGEIYWKLVRSAESILNETGYEYVEVSDWPRKTYRIPQKGFDLVISASIDTGTVYRLQVVIHPVTSENYIYIDDLKRRLNETIVGDGLA